MNVLRKFSVERAKLDQLDARIEELLAEIEQTQDALLPHDEAVSRFRRSLEDQIKGRRVASSFSAWQSPLATHGELGRLGEFGFLERAYLDGVDEVVERFRARIEASGKTVGLPTAARSKRIADLQTELDASMRDAEREAMRLEDLGFNPGRQVHADAERQARIMFEVWGGSTLGAGERPSLPPAAPASKAEGKASRSLSELGRSLNEGARGLDLADGPGIDSHIAEVGMETTLAPRARRK